MRVGRALEEKQSENEGVEEKGGEKRRNHRRRKLKIK